MCDDERRGHGEVERVISGLHIPVLSLVLIVLPKLRAATVAIERQFDRLPARRQPVSMSGNQCKFKKL